MELSNQGGCPWTAEAVVWCAGHHGDSDHTRQFLKPCLFSLSPENNCKIYRGCKCEHFLRGKILPFVCNTTHACTHKFYVCLKTGSWWNKIQVHASIKYMYMQSFNLLIYLYLEIEVELPGLDWFDPMWIIHKVQSFVGVFSFWHWSGMSSIDGPINELDARLGYNVHGHVIWSCGQIKYRIFLYMYIRRRKKNLKKICTKLGNLDPLIQMHT